MAVELNDVNLKAEAQAAHDRAEKEHAKLEKKHVAFLICFQICSMVAYGLCTTYDKEVLADGVTANTISQYYPMFQDVHVMIFIGFGFLMTFMKKYGFSSVSFNFVLAAMTIQYAILMNGFWHQLIVETKPWHSIKLDITSLITGDFAAGAVLISFGAVLGKTSLEQLVCMMVFEIIFYGINESIGAGLFEAVDMGGSMFVHTFGAYFGLGVSSVLTRGSKVDASDKFGSTKTSDMFAMVGTLFLWMFWPSFNGALATGNQQHRVVVNTVLALTNSCVAAFLFSKLMRPGKRLDMVDIQNATLAGGVAVGSSADLVIGPWGALLVGFVAGMVSVIGYTVISPKMEKKGLHDTCGVHNLHGMPGVIGGIGGAISAATAGSEAYGDNLTEIFSGMSCAEGSKCRTASQQGGFQAAALIVTLCFSIFGGIFTGMIMKQMHHTEDYGEDAENWNIEEEEEHEPVRGESKELVEKV